MRGGAGAAAVWLGQGSPAVEGAGQAGGYLWVEAVQYALSRVISRNAAIKFPPHENDRLQAISQVELLKNDTIIQGRHIPCKRTYRS